MPFTTPAVAPSSPAPSITFCSFADIGNDVSAKLEDKPVRTILTTAPTGTAGASATVADIRFWTLNRFITFDDGSTEEARIIDVSALPVIGLERGVNGTAGHAHSDGVGVWMNYRYSPSQITTAMTETVAELYPWAYQIAELLVTPVAGTRFYDIADDAFRRLITVTQVPTGSPSYVARYGPGEMYPVYVEPGVPDALSTTRQVLNFPTFNNLTNAVLVRYAKELDSTTIECGLMAEVVALGACAKLVSNKAIPRVAAEDTTQADATVTPNARLGVGGTFQIAYERERAKLAARFLEHDGLQVRYVGKATVRR